MYTKKHLWYTLRPEKYANYAMTPVNNDNLAFQIRLKLEEEINGGALLPGDALDERELATRFGVSRTPVREAITQLAAQGLLKTAPRQGVYVARMSIQELLSMFELLAEMEGVCAKYCARRLTDGQRTRLADVHRNSLKFVEADDAVGYSQSNVDFHAILYVGCHNAFLAEHLRSIRRRTQMYRQNTFMLPGRMRISYEDHQRVLDAILSADANAAQQYMIEHISVGGKGFAEFVSTMPRHMFESHDIAYPKAQVSLDP
jgi:DNA-binding GntR family transcriptional regulator